MLKTLHSALILSSTLLFRFYTIPGSQNETLQFDSLKSPNNSQTANHAPVVKIIQPANNSRYDWSARVPYSIDVSDAEDGESKYQEIQSAEVFVKLKYIGNNEKGASFLNEKKSTDSAVITSLMVSNCFNCHGIKSKLAGPSFQDISKKYQNTAFYREQLVNRIQKGSTGIWGKEVMPTHPELPDMVIRQMVKWILNNANDPGLNYFTGLQGVLLLNKPRVTDRSGFFVVTAYYTDHGTVEFPKKRLTGSDQVMIQMNYQKENN